MSWTDFCWRRIDPSPIGVSIKLNIYGDNWYYYNKHRFLKIFLQDRINKSFNLIETAREDWIMRKIKLKEFSALPDQERYDIVLQIGKFLDTYVQGNKKYVLYAVDLFFVEVEYDNSINKITGNRAFVAGDLLDKYSNL